MKNPSLRQIQLEQCLLENMQRQPYCDITISGLCRQVDISRRGFYLYFKDLDACLHSLMERTFQELLLVTATSLGESSTPLDACRTVLAVIREHRMFLELLIRNRLLDVLVTRIIHYSLHGGDCFLPVSHVTASRIDPDLLACLVSSQLALVLRWHEQDYAPALEEMAQKLLKLTDIVLP